MNTLRSMHKQCHFNRTKSQLYLVKQKWRKRADRLLQCVLLNRLFQTFAENRLVFHSFLSQLIKVAVWRS